MKFTPKFNQNDIRRFILKKIEVVENVILDQLIAVGEQFVADARTTNTYIDRTSNLRGSIGYVILKDGSEIFGNFEGIATGQQIAKQFVKRISGEHSRGFVLIVVAGMEYAAFVEAKGYDVVTGSSQGAETNLERSLDRLKKQLGKIQ